MDQHQYLIHDQLQGKLTMEITDLSGNVRRLELGEVGIPVDFAVSTGHGPTPQEKINELNVVIDDLAQVITTIVKNTGLSIQEGHVWYDLLKKHRPELLKDLTKDTGVYQ